MNKRSRVSLVAGAAVLLGMASTGPASADGDWGGYANPGSAACGTNYPVVGVQLKDSAGNVGGYLRLKWSNGCPGNYGWIQSYGNSKKLSVTVKDIDYPTIQAGSDYRDTSTVWTNVLRLQHSSDAACVYGDMWQGNEMHHYSGVACAYS